MFQTPGAVSDGMTEDVMEFRANDGAQGCALFTDLRIPRPDYRPASGGELARDGARQAAPLIDEMSGMPMQLVRNQACVIDALDVSIRKASYFTRAYSLHYLRRLKPCLRL